MLSSKSEKSSSGAGLDSGAGEDMRGSMSDIIDSSSSSSSSSSSTLSTLGGAGGVGFRFLLGAGAALAAFALAGLGFELAAVTCFGASGGLSVEGLKSKIGARISSTL